jgi:hypothetical protein
LTYSFAEDWHAFGHLIATCLGVRIKPSGEFVSAGENNIPILLNAFERVLLKRLVTPSRFDLLDSATVIRSMDEIVASIAPIRRCAGRNIHPLHSCERGPWRGRV